jgi:hypothetical protein
MNELFEGLVKSINAYPIVAIIICALVVSFLVYLEIKKNFRKKA